MKLNGERIDLPTAITLKAFLAGQGYELSRIAVEMDGTIIPRAQYESILLQDEAVLEVVRFVGGG